jgi:DNA repair exonuclease SbcCD nuclease subunit
MIRKLIHLADLHVRTYKMHEEYIEIFDKFLAEAKQIASEFKYGEVRIVIVGDLVHQKINVSNEQMILLSDFLHKCSEIAPVIIVAGNHDLLENNKERMDSITPIIKMAKNPNIHYYKDRACFLDDNIVWCNYSIFEGNQPPNIKKAREIHGDDKRYVGLFHAPIAGCTTDSGYELTHGASLDHFVGCQIVLMGDIHKRQFFEYNGIKLAFPSSLIQQGYGESITNHGFLVWDVETLDYTEHNIENDYGFYQFKINSLDDLELGKDILVND